MKRFLPLALIAFAFLTGCVSYDEEARNALNALRVGDINKTLQWSGELATNSHYSAALGQVEHARVNAILGDYEEASRWYRIAIDSAIDRAEAQPKIKLSEVTHSVLSATITDDRAVPYLLAPYELNLALAHGIIAQELSGDRQAALVDSRLAVYVQDTLAATYGADVAKAETINNKTSRAIYAGNVESLTELIAQTRNSWENPVLWWLTGVLFEAEGSNDMAEQSYRKALAIRGDCDVFKNDAMRSPKKVAPNKAKLAVVVGDGLVRERKALKVPIPIYTGMSFDMPMYTSADEYIPRQIRMVFDGRDVGFANPALNIQSLAARDLKEKMPGVIVRNVTRAALQAGAQVAVNAHGNEYARLAVFAGNLIISAIRSADLRSWRTLPAGEQVWVSEELEPGTHEISAMAGFYSAKAAIELKPGETKVIYLNIIGDKHE